MCKIRRSREKYGWRVVCVLTDRVQEMEHSRGPQLDRCAGVLPATKRRGQTTLVLGLEHSIQQLRHLLQTSLHNGIVRCPVVIRDSK